jgi:N-acetylglucosamine-6-phosphate deacetylase
MLLQENSSTVLMAARLWNGNQIVDHPVVVVEEGCIASITSRDAYVLPAHARVIEFQGATLTPPFFDVHTHGCAGHDVMEASREALHAIAGFLAAHGTGSFLATTVTAPLDATLRALEGLARAIQQPAGVNEARMLGIHLEGPFLSHRKRGVHPPGDLVAPDIQLFDRLYEAAGGQIRLMTVAPELPGALELIEHAVPLGVCISLGHSDATAAETRAAIAAGARSATHTFNAMRPLDHREPGILGTVLSNDALFAEIICDGVHTAPEMVKLWWRAKGPHHALLVTDAMSATGMPDGEYELGGFAVHVEKGKATANGVLAGSVLTLDRALCNFVDFTGASIDEGLRLLTANPAAMTGLEEEADHGALGQGANFVAVDATGKLIASLRGGKVI